MKKKKLTLNELRVKSFTTSLNASNAETVNGGEKQITGWICENSTILITVGSECCVENSDVMCYGNTDESWCICHA